MAPASCPPTASAPCPPAPLAEPAALSLAWWQLQDGQQPPNTHTEPERNKSLPPPLSWTMMVSAKHLRGGFLHLQSSARALEAAQRKGTSLSYSRAVALRFGQTETAETRSAVPLESPGLADIHQILRDQFKELWDLVFLCFVVSGHHHPELELSLSYLPNHFPDLSGSFFLK